MKNKKPGRPRKYEKSVRRTVELDSELNNKLVKAADRFAGGNATALVARLIEKYVKKPSPL